MTYWKATLQKSNGASTPARNRGLNLTWSFRVQKAGIQVLNLHPFLPSCVTLGNSFHLAAFTCIVHKTSRITVSPTGLCHGRCHSSSTVYGNISFTLMLHYRVTGSIVPVLSSGHASLFKDTKNPCTEKKHLSKMADYITTEKVMKAEWYRHRFHGKVSPCELAPHTEKPVGEGRIWCQQWNSMVSDKNTVLWGLYKICFCNKNVSKLTLFILVRNVHKGNKVVLEWYMHTAVECNLFVTGLLINFCTTEIHPYSMILGNV